MSSTRTFSRTAFTIAMLNMGATLLTGFSMPKNNSQLRRWAASLVRGNTYEVTLEIADSHALRHSGLSMKRYGAELDIYLDVENGHTAIHGARKTRWVLDDDGFELRSGKHRYSTPEDTLVARALLSGIQNGLWGCTGVDERGAPFFPSHDEIAESVLCPPGIIPNDHDVQLLFRTRGKWQELQGIAVRDDEGHWSTALVVDQVQGAPIPDGAGLPR